MRVPSSDGVVVAVHDLGGSGAPLLIAHATGFCGGAYMPLAAELADRFHVFALDFRAHGESTAPGAEALAWERMTDDLEATVDAVAEGRPLRIVGHSMGGACALRLEARRPGTLRWAYVFEPIVTPSGLPTDRPNPLSDGAARRRATFPSKAAALARYASRPPLNVLRADSLAAYVEHGFRENEDGTVTLRCAPESEAGTFGATGSVTIDQLAAVAVPVTVARGALALDAGPAAWADQQVAALPQGRLDAFDGLGHFGPLQDPVAVGRAILAFDDGARAS